MTEPEGVNRQDRGPGGLLPTALVGVLGILIGLSAYTFVYARGYSYLLDDPRACVNCHVMRENYQSWTISSHRSVTCNGCHTPHELVEKYLVKAENGVAHSFAFTFEDPQVIRIRPRSLQVVERNCRGCHEQTLAGTFLAVDDESERCVRCHPATGHALGAFAAGSASAGGFKERVAESLE
ncbi:MAG: cytochrome c nitrite reductase small subunit [Chloroflexi bacterium]|nr:cytochrome c nitrite reductase small subunit [Chloroflexota bacterium]